MYTYADKYADNFKPNTHTCAACERARAHTHTHTHAHAHTHTNTHTQREREREKEIHTHTPTHTHTHTHTHAHAHRHTHTHTETLNAKQTLYEFYCIRDGQLLKGTSERRSNMGDFECVVKAINVKDAPSQTILLKLGNKDNVKWRIKWGQVGPVC